MKGAGVQYLIVIEMVVRMEKECKNTNEEENMKKNNVFNGNKLKEARIYRGMSMGELADEI